MSTTLRSVDDYHRVADRLRRLPVVIAADVLERDPRVDGPAIELTVGAGLEQLPPAVVRVLGESDLGMRALDRRPGGHWVVLAV